MPGLISIEELSRRESTHQGAANGAGTGRPPDSINVAEAMAEVYAALSPSGGDGSPISLRQLVHRLATAVERGATTGDVEREDTMRVRSAQEENLDRASERQHAPRGTASAASGFPFGSPEEGFARQGFGEPGGSDFRTRSTSRRRSLGHDQEDPLSDMATRAAHACILVGD